MHFSATLDSELAPEVHGNQALTPRLSVQRPGGCKDAAQLHGREDGAQPTDRLPPARLGPPPPHAQAPRVCSTVSHALRRFCGALRDLSTTATRHATSINSAGQTITRSNVFLISLGDHIRLQNVAS